MSEELKFSGIFELFPSPDNSTRIVLTKVYLAIEFIAFHSLHLDYYLSVIGAVLTILHLIILTRKPMMTSSVMSIMISIAFCDLISMLSSIGARDTALNTEGTDCSPPISLLTYRIFWFSLSLRDDVIRCSTWLSVIMALIRFYVLKFVNTASSQKLSRFSFGFSAFGVSFSVSTVFSTFYFMRSKFVKAREWEPAEHCTDFPLIGSQAVYEAQVADIFTVHDGILMRIYMFLNGIASRILPCVLLPVLTVFLILELRKAKDQRKVSNASDKNKKERTTGLVIFMAVTFFIALLPTGIVTSFQAVYTDLGFIYLSQYVDQICFTLLTINASIHCFICFTMSSQYRSTVRSLLRIPNRSVVSLRPLYTTMFLLEIRESVQFSAAICSIVTNCFLFYLIAYKSPSEIGNYKYLLQCVSLFEMLYGVLDIIASPITFTVGCIFMVIIPINDKYFGRQGAMFLNTVYCFFFGFSMGMFVVIFAYRLMISRGDRTLLHFKGLKIISLFIFPLFYGFVWGLISSFPFAPTPEKDDFIKDEIREKLNMTLDEIAYTAPFYYSKNHQKVIISSVLSISVQWILVALSLFLVGWFGLKCYSHIRKLLETQQTRSPKLQDLQNQLFLALVLQASIPILLMHIPVIILYTFSLLNWDFDPIIVCITISLFPALDPFPTIFVIRGYREACFEIMQKGLRWMCCLTPRSSFELRTVSVVL